MKKIKSDNQIDSFVSKLLSNRCRLASILTAIFIFSVTTVYASPQHNYVRILDGDYEVTGYSYGATVRDVIGEHGIDVQEHDVVYPDMDAKVTSGLVIVIDRPRRVNLTCDGATISYWTSADNFGEFVNMHDIGMSESDIASFNPKDELELVNDVSIIRVNTTTEKITEEIPFETTYVKDNSISKGTSVVRTEGKPGVKLIEYEVVSHDGVEVSRQAVSETVELEPVSKVIAEGTKVPQPVVAASVASAAPAQIGANTLTVNGQVFNYSKMITCSATAYDLSFESTGKRPGDYGYGITASGTYAKRGTVAVDPRVIPLGTKMYIVSTDGSIVYGICTAEDTGGAIKGNKVDLFYDTAAECMQFGRRSVNVYILQ